MVLKIESGQRVYTFFRRRIYYSIAAQALVDLRNERIFMLNCSAIFNLKKLLLNLRWCQECRLGTLAILHC